MPVVTEDAAWSAALAERFYREEYANRPAFLCVDEESLAELAQDERLMNADNMSEAEIGAAAVQALARAVKTRVRASAPLEPWTQDAMAWRRSGHTGPPPFLSVLAITVLAATTVSGRNRGSYYGRLNDLLGLPE